MSDNSGRSRIRCIPILALLALASAAASAAFCISRWDGFAERYRLEEHMEAYRDRKPGNVAIIPVVAYSSTYPVTVLRTVETDDRDSLHARIEAVLADPSEAEIADSIRSWIPEGTRLLGASEKNGYIFVDLSEEMRGAPDLAYEEIGRSLALWKDYKSVRFMIDGRLTEKRYSP